MLKLKFNVEYFPSKLKISRIVLKQIRIAKINRKLFFWKIFWLNSVTLNFLRCIFVDWVTSYEWQFCWSIQNNTHLKLQIIITVFANFLLEMLFECVLKNSSHCESLHFWNELWKLRSIFWIRVVWCICLLQTHLTSLKYLSFDRDISHTSWL